MPARGFSDRREPSSTGFFSQAASGGYPLSARLGIAIDIGTELQHAHSRGVFTAAFAGIHLDHGWRAQVLDPPFHAPESAAAYRAPEQVRGDAPDSRTLFQTRPLQKSWNLYDVTPDGQRFLVNGPLEWAISSDIMVITNWTEKLKD